IFDGWAVAPGDGDCTSAFAAGTSRSPAAISTMAAAQFVKICIVCLLHAVTACEKNGNTAPHANGIRRKQFQVIVQSRHVMNTCRAALEQIVRRGELDDAWPHQPRLKETALGEQCLEPGSDGGVGPAADVRPLWPKLHRVTSPSTSGPSTRRRTACCVSSWTSTARWSSASIRISGCCTAGPRS